MEKLLWSAIDAHCIKCQQVSTMKPAVTSCCKAVIHESCYVNERCKKCESFYQCITENAALLAYRENANKAQIEDLYQRSDKETRKNIHTISGNYRSAYFPVHLNIDLDTDNWTYGIFRGFDWSNFTLSCSGIADFTQDMQFILWTASYPEMRSRLTYFYKFIAQRIPVDILTTVKGNNLRLHITGMQRGICLLIIYRNLMEASLTEHPLMIHNNTTYRDVNESATETAQTQTKSPILRFQEKPEAFYKRTGVPAVSTSFILDNIFPEWKMVCHIGRGDYVMANFFSKFSKRYSWLLPIELNFSSEPIMARVTINSNIKSARVSALTPVKMLSSIYKVVYSQRTLGDLSP
jgi:hypothetical protein